MLRLALKSPKFRLRLLERAVTAALRKAGSTALRDMRSEATKLVRQQKTTRLRDIRKALVMRKPTSRQLNRMRWRLDIAGEPVSLMAYRPRQNRRGVSVSVNRGKRTLLRGAFIARLASGKVAVFRRRGRERLPIRMLLGSRPVDALLKTGKRQMIARRGRRSLVRRFSALYPGELRKRILKAR